MMLFVFSPFQEILILSENSILLWLWGFSDTIQNQKQCNISEYVYNSVKLMKEPTKVGRRASQQMVWQLL